MVYGTPPPKPAPRTGLGEFLPPFLEPENLPATVEANLPARLGVAALNATYVDYGTAATTYARLGLTPRAKPVPFTYRTLALPPIARIGFGRFTCTIDTDALRPAAGAAYYVSPTGTSGAAGTSAAAPLTLAAAVAKSDVGTIWYAPGEYFRNTNTPGVIGTKSINHRASFPGVYLTGFENPALLTWTLTSGNVYQATRSNTNAVVDKRAAYMDANGDYAMYEQKTGDNTALTAAGQWATNGTTTWVWPLGNVNLATDSSFMRLSINTGSSVINSNGNTKQHLSWLNIEGGGGPTVGPLGAFSSGGTGGVPALVAVDCTVKYAPTNGITLTGASYGVFVRCGVAKTINDGFNYHSGTLSGTTYTPDVLEVDCWSRSTGLYQTTVETQNGSTAHDDVRIIRVGGEYKLSYGPAVADDSGAKSWNLGVRAGQSTAPNRNWAFAATATDSHQWLDECDVIPGFGGVYADGTSRVHLKDCRTGSVLGVAAATQASGLVDTYS
jgi:hypothetical protein